MKYIRIFKLLSIALFFLLIILVSCNYSNSDKSNNSKFSSQYIEKSDISTIANIKINPNIEKLDIGSEVYRGFILDNVYHSSIGDIHYHSYFPSNYNENNKYNVFYLMHGGWCNEALSLGTPSNSSKFKNVIDNMIKNKGMDPLIIVCPTYNNISSNDSSSFSLALQMTRNYHNELINDLILALNQRILRKLYYLR